MADYYGLSSGVIFEWPLEISFAERNNFTYSFNDHIAPQKTAKITTQELTHMTAMCCELK